MRRWGHGHSVAAGVIVGLAADHNTLILAAGCFLGGVAVTLLARHLRRGLYLGRELVAAKIRREEASARSLLERADHHLLKVDEQKRERDRSYWQGARDGANPVMNRIRSSRLSKEN